MLANNNKKVIDKLAKHTLKNSGKKYIILGIAVFLSTFMLFSVFTLGITYLDMQKRQEIRLYGHDVDASLMNGYTGQQKHICEDFKNVISVGSTCYAGYPIKSEKSENLHYAFIYADPVFWNQQAIPARTSQKGRYPEKENELMVTKKALEDCGMAGLTVGDSLSLTYADLSGTKTKDFMISGIWEGYGPKDFYVSKAFLDTTGYKTERYGILYLKFQNFILSKGEQERLRQELNLSIRQSLSFSGYRGKSISILTGLIFISLVTCLLAYLLIYNILHLSVQGNIRYFGLLFTLGMTKKQLNRFLNLKIFWVGIFGISGGLFTALISSLFLIPAAAQALGLKAQQVVVTFHPGIFAGTICLAALTIYLGNKKPVKAAAEISPMEALKFQTVPAKTSRKNNTAGNPLWKMAWEQLTKDWKKTAVTLASFTLCLTVFLCLSTIVKGQSDFTSNFIDEDLVIQNNTQSYDNPREWKDVLTDTLIQEIESDPGVETVNPLLAATIIVPWEKDFADLWMKGINEFFMDEPYEKTLKDYKAHPENYYSFIQGINEREFDALNENLEAPVDREAFLKGECCILSSAYVLGETDVTGKKVTCRMDGKEKPHSFQIAAAVSDGSYSMHTAGGPVIVVCDRFLKENAENIHTIRLSVSYKKAFDETVENNIKQILDQTSKQNSFFLESKIENRKELKKAQGNMTGVGIGITCILALIGAMNYINTVSCSIQNRKVALAVMESIGMSKKQTDKMLILEGLLYAAASLGITGTLGVFIIYFVFQSVNYQGVPFSLPLMPAIAMALLVIALCVLVPPAAYRVITRRESIVERIHGFE